KDQPFEQVTVAVEAFYRDGRDFPPNGAQILGKLSELSRDDVDWADAWALAKRASLKEPQEAWSWLEERSPPAVEAVRRLGCGNRQSILTFQLDDEPTVRAQFRDIYKAVCAERRRDDTYAGLPSAGLRSLERRPHRIGEALRRALPE